MRVFLFLIVLSISFVQCALAQEEGILVQAEVDKSVLTIGDKITYSVIITHDPQFTINSTITPPIINNFEMREAFELDPYIDDQGYKVIGRKFIYTTFTLGDYIIPGEKIIYIDDDGYEKIITTNPLFITVEAVSSDEKKDIKDIKMPKEITENYDWFYWIIGFILIVPSTIWITKKVFLLIKNKKRQDKVSLLPPAEELLQTLDTLKKSVTNTNEVRIVETGYSQLSNTVKRYLERKYSIVTVDKTTRELVILVRKHDFIDNETSAKIENVLHECDMVKFARHVITPEQFKKSIQLVKEVVSATESKKVAIDDLLDNK